VTHEVSAAREIVTDTLHCPDDKVAVGGGGRATVLRDSDTFFADLIGSTPESDGGWFIRIGLQDGQFQPGDTVVVVHRIVCVTAN
jgi:hypothetical protein